jgi:hypothetical protein
MTKKYFLFAGLILSLLIGCESPPVRREQLLAENNWPEEIKALIRKGYLAKGMTKSQVKAAWGNPCYSCSGTTGSEGSLGMKDDDKWGAAWEYQTQIVFFNQQQKVIRWENK